MLFSTFLGTNPVHCVTTLTMDVLYSHFQNIVKERYKTSHSFTYFYVYYASVPLETKLRVTTPRHWLSLPPPLPSHHVLVCVLYHRLYFPTWKFCKVFLLFRFSGNNMVREPLCHRRPSLRFGIGLFFIRPHCSVHLFLEEADRKVTHYTTTIIIEKLPITPPPLSSFTPLYTI